MKGKKAQLSLLMKLVIMIVAVMIIISVFMVMFGRTGKIAETGLGFGPLKVGSGHVQPVVVDVPVSAKKDFDNLVKAFEEASTAHKDKYHCYIIIPALTIGKTDDSKDFSLEILSEASAVTISILSENRPVKGESKKIEGVGACAIIGTEGKRTAGGAFHDYFRKGETENNLLFGTNITQGFIKWDFLHIAGKKYSIKTKNAMKDGVAVHVLFKMAKNKLCIVPTNPVKNDQDGINNDLIQEIIDATKLKNPIPPCEKAEDKGE